MTDATQDPLRAVLNEAKNIAAEQLKVPFQSELAYLALNEFPYLLDAQDVVDHLSEHYIDDEKIMLSMEDVIEAIRSAMVMVKLPGHCRIIGLEHNKKRHYGVIDYSDMTHKWE